MNMVQHHSYRMMTIEIILGDQLTKCADNEVNNRERKELEKGSGRKGNILSRLSLPLFVFFVS